jgi:hypothetical protein
VSATPTQFQVRGAAGQISGILGAIMLWVPPWYLGLTHWKQFRRSIQGSLGVPPWYQTEEPNGDRSALSSARGSSVAFSPPGPSPRPIPHRSPPSIPAVAPALTGCCGFAGPGPSAAFDGHGKVSPWPGGRSTSWAGCEPSRRPPKGFSVVLDRSEADASTSSSGNDPSGPRFTSKNYGTGSPPVASERYPEVGSPLA